MNSKSLMMNGAVLALSAAATAAILDSTAVAQQRSSRSASASVGRLANTSASANVYWWYFKDYDTGVYYYYNAQNSASLMVTDVNEDGMQDIKVVLTSTLAGYGYAHGFLIIDGATGIAVTNEVYSQG